jgi:hypothetical protein
MDDRSTELGKCWPAIASIKQALLKKSDLAIACLE